MIFCGLSVTFLHCKMCQTASNLLFINVLNVKSRCDACEKLLIKNLEISISFL